MKREGDEGGNRRERRKKELMKGEIGEGEGFKDEWVRDNQLERGADGEGRWGGSGKVRGKRMGRWKERRERGL